MGVFLQSAGVAVQVVGVAALFWCWRARRPSNGVVLVAGWLSIFLGGAPWLLAVSVERGLALAMLAPMLAGLALLAPDALPRIGSASAGRRRPSRIGDAGQGDAPSASGRRERIIARWAGSLVTVPALALAAMAVTLAADPGPIVDRAAVSILVLAVVWIATLLWLLAAERPWRVALSSGVGAATMAALTYTITRIGAPI